MISQDDIDAFKEEAGQVSSENIREYFNQLRGHDWYYDYSDDYRVWQRGSQNREMFMKQSEENIDNKRMVSEQVKWSVVKSGTTTAQEFTSNDKGDRRYKIDR